MAVRKRGVLDRVQGKEYRLLSTESMEARGWEADLGLNSFPYLLTLLLRCL